MAMNNPYAAYQKFARNAGTTVRIPVSDLSQPHLQPVPIEKNGNDSSPQESSQSTQVVKTKMPYSFPDGAGDVTTGGKTQTSSVDATGKLMNVAGVTDLRQSGANNQGVQNTNRYMENEVMTASPEKLTLMLYEGAIRFMNQAVVYINAKNAEKANNTLVKAQDIFTELMCTLDMDYPISKDLYRMYDFIKTSLIHSNIKKDTFIIRDMISFARDLRDTWVQAMKIAAVQYKK